MPGLAAAGLLILGASGAASATDCQFQYMAPANISTTITADAAGFTYGYAVDAVSVCDAEITSVSMPFAMDARIGAIAAPQGWSYSVSDADSFGMGAGMGTLTWTASAGHGIRESTSGNVLSGFSFWSPYGSSTEVYGLVTDTLGEYDIYDIDPAIPAVPEASSGSMLLLAAGALLAVARRRGAARARDVQAA
jgi:hypothetical protein